MGDIAINSTALALLAIPGQVRWSYFSFGIVLVIGLGTVSLRRQWQVARGLDKLILLGPVFYAAPLAAFGTEHFTLTSIIASLVPAWIPWHLFWAYLVGTCFIAAGLSLATGIQRRLSASLLAVTFFLFVALMDVPGWLHDLRNRFALALVLRELSFGAGALALAASLAEPFRERPHTLAGVARYSFAIALLVYSFEQFRHGNYVPVVPLDKVTPPYVFGHAVWAYATAAVYGLAGTLLLMGKNTRAAATWAGLTGLFVEVVVYVPIAIAERADLQGFNYLADSLMFCGAALMLAAAMPRVQTQQH